MTETKSYVEAEVKALEGGHPNGEFEVVLSVPTRDRHGEVVDAGAFDPLPESIPFHVDHNHSYAALVGRAVPRYEGPLLLAKGHYTASPLAQSVREDVKAGNLNTVSIGFANGVRKAIGGVPHLVKGELVEGSFVTVPANARTMVLSAKALAAPDAQIDLDVLISEAEQLFD